MVNENATVQLDRKVDMVITSGGGYPLDANFYQISKALVCAKNILNKGGTIVVACECREGMGSDEFCGILQSVCSPQEFFEGYCDPKNFVIDQWCAQNIYQVMDYVGKVFVYSPGLSSADLEQIGAVKIQSVQETVNEQMGSHEKVVAVPDGPYVVGIVRQY
jgi:nickel-dependent lactate racemase